LLDSAVSHFSRVGYDGASLRDIARDADVPLSAIHHYFGSKTDLFAAVARQAWDEVDEERSRLLDRARARAGVGGTPRLETLIHALAYPVVRRANGPNRRDRAQILVVCSHRGRGPHEVMARILEVADRSMTRWIEAMIPSCPGLSREEVIWAFSFVVGTIYSWQLLDQRYEKMLGAGCKFRDAEEITGDIVAFCCKGIEAICDRRRTEPGLRLVLSA
jgi:AcrR family transcriptional regulator